MGEYRSKANVLKKSFSEPDIDIETINKISIVDDTAAIKAIKDLKRSFGDEAATQGIFVQQQSSLV